MQPPGSDKQFYEEKMKLINMAYNVLSNEKSKAEYDGLLNKQNDQKWSSTRYESQDNTERWSSELAKEWMERVIVENKGNNAFEVLVTGDNIGIPELCTCCLDKPDPNNGTSVSYSWTENKILTKTEHSIAIPFPLCKKCAEHQKELKRKRINLILSSVTIPLFLIAITLITSTQVPWVELMVFAAGITLVSLLLCSRFFKLSGIEDHHSHRGNSVEFVNYNELGVIRLRFFNWNYAELFARQNNSEVETVVIKKYTRGLSLLKGKLAIQVISSALSLIFIVSTVMFIYLTPSNLTSSNHYPAKPSSARSNIGNGSNIPLVAIPQNGSTREYFYDEAIAPLRIVTENQNIYYLVKVVEWTTKDTVMTIFIHGGKSVDVDLPLGEYEIRYAVGEEWHGYKYLFGPSTIYKKAEEKFVFDVLGNYVHGYTLELFSQVNGNLSTTIIDENEF